MIVTDTFKALGDPVRLEMLTRLSKGNHYSVGSLSSGLGLTRQGARKHLDVLAKACLVSLVPKGRETEVRLDTTAISEARAFITGLEQQWDARLGALRDFVESSENKNTG